MNCEVGKIYWVKVCSRYFIYHFMDRTSEIIFRVTDVRDTFFSCEPIADNTPTPALVSQWNFRVDLSDFDQIKELTSKDLPLYIWMAPVYEGGLKPLL